MLPIHFKHTWLRFQIQNCGLTTLRKWEASDQTQPTELLGHGVPVTSREGVYWLEGNYYLVQPYATKFGDEPTQKGINYWYYDTEAKRFRIYLLQQQRSVHRRRNRYEGVIEGNTLTFERPARF